MTIRVVVQRRADDGIGGIVILTPDLREHLMIADTRYSRISPRVSNLPSNLGLCILPAHTEPRHSLVPAEVDCLRSDRVAARIHCDQKSVPLMGHKVGVANPNRLATNLQVAEIQPIALLAHCSILRFSDEALFERSEEHTSE